MNRRSKLLLLIPLLCLLISETFSWADSSLDRCVVRLKIQSAAHNPLRPWQMESSESRSGQAVAVGEYELLAIASQVRDHRLIQVQTANQSPLVPAQVKIADYDLDLCLLSVNPKDLSEPFIPVSFKTSVKMEDSIQFVWLTEDQRFLKTKGRIEHADTFFSPRSQTGFFEFVASSESFPGGFTEAVFQGNKVVGLVQNLDSDKKTSTLLPASLIQSFLKKAKATPYLGTPKAGFDFTPLSDQITRAWLKLPPEEKRGVTLKDVFDFGTGSGELKKNDVLLKWGSFDVDSKGAVLLEGPGKVSLWSLLGSASPGEKVPCVLWRDGALMNLPLTLKTFSSASLPIPYESSDTASAYFITGGYLFQELTLPYLDTFGNNWSARLNPVLKMLTDKYRLHSIPGKKRIVLMTQVLPHPINQGYQHLRQKVLNRVNGQPVTELKDLPSLFSQSPPENCYRITLEEHSTDILIPAKDLASANLQIQQLYSIPRLSSLEEEKKN